jgi:hypothetical protein
MKAEKPSGAQQGLERVHDALEATPLDPDEVDRTLRDTGLDPEHVEMRLRNLAEATIRGSQTTDAIRSRLLSWFETFLEDSSRLVSVGDMTLQSRSGSTGEEPESPPIDPLRDEHQQALQYIFEGQYAHAATLLGKLLLSAPAADLPWLRWSYHHVLLQQNRIGAARQQLELLLEETNTYAERAMQRLQELSELN